MHWERLKWDSRQASALKYRLGRIEWRVAVDPVTENYCLRSLARVGHATNGQGHDETRADTGQRETWGEQQSRQPDQSTVLCDQIWAVLDLGLLLDQPTIMQLRPGKKKKLCTFSLWAHNSSSIAVVYFRLRFFHLLRCATGRASFGLKKRRRN